MNELGSNRGDPLLARILSVDVSNRTAHSLEKSNTIAHLSSVAPFFFSISWLAERLAHFENAAILSEDYQMEGYHVVKKLFLDRQWAMRTT